jgi:hypothetical protein
MRRLWVPLMSVLVCCLTLSRAAAAVPLGGVVSYQKLGKTEWPSVELLPGSRFGSDIVPLGDLNGEPPPPCSCFFPLCCLTSAS